MFANFLINYIERIYICIYTCISTYLTRVIVRVVDRSMYIHKSTGKVRKYLGYEVSYCVLSQLTISYD